MWNSLSTGNVEINVFDMDFTQFLGCLDRLEFFIPEETPLVAEADSYDMNTIIVSR